MSTTNEVAGTVGGPVAAASVCLRVFGSNLRPEDITAIFKQEPSMSYKQGDQISRSVKTLRKRGMWLLNPTCGETASPEDQIVTLLNMVTTDLDGWRQLVEMHSVDLYCTIRINSDMSGFGLSESVLRMLSERGLRVEFEIVIVEDDESPVGIAAPTVEGVDGGGMDCSTTNERR
jgi:hypothetical protein